MPTSPSGRSPHSGADDPFFPAAALLALVLVAPTAAGPEVVVRPWRGILPDPDPSPDANWFVCHVLDARTRASIAGARWIRTPEWIAPWRVHHDTVLGVAVTDADGVRTPSMG